jgi:hypothetical protein
MAIFPAILEINRVVTLSVGKCDSLKFYHLGAGQKQGLAQE